MNISWYIEGDLIGQETNVTNGTYSELFLQVSNYSTRYNWSLLVETVDDAYTVDGEYTFKSERKSGAVALPDRLIWIWVMVAIMLGLISLIGIQRRRGKRNF